MKISIGCRNFKLGRDWSLCLLSALNAAPHVFTTKLFNLLAIKQPWVSLLGSPFHSQTLVPLNKSLQAMVFQNAVFPQFSAVLIRAWSCLLRPYKEARLYYFYLVSHVFVYSCPAPPPLVSWFSWFFMVPGWFFMVFRGSRLVFMAPGWFFMVFHGSRSVFMVPGWLFMVIHGSQRVFTVSHGSRLV